MMQKNELSGVSSFANKAMLWLGKTPGAEAGKVGFTIDLKLDEDHVIVPKGFDFFPQKGQDIALIRIADNKVKDNLNEWL